MRVYEITPGCRTDVDSVIIRAGDSWQPVKDEVEQSLDRQWAEMKDGARRWDEIRVKIQCREMTQEQLGEGI